MSIFPTVEELASHVMDYSDSLLKSGLEPEPGEDEVFGDIRLQVFEGWAVYTGAADYDQDHRGWWGASSVSARCSDDEARDVARDLIEQAKDMQAQAAG